MTLSDWPGIQSGTKAIVTEIYHEGIMIEWQTGDVKMYRIGRTDQHLPEDGFSIDDMQYLAFCTLKHPKVDAEVYNIQQNA